ncbi:MAG TPA: alpha/beta fold hydrolase [Actinomycetota bacterium]
MTVDDRSHAPLVTRARGRAYGVATQPFRVVTKDGVRLSGDRLGDGPVALVVCHGFTGWHRKPRMVRLQEALVPWFTIYAFDFRGHGASGGRSAFGAVEELDVEAVVRLARRDGFEQVATLGGSMGGIAAIRHAALCGGVDAVVAASTPATWQGHATRAVRRFTWFTSRRPGQVALGAIGVRVVRVWEGAEAPIEVVGRIAPTPLILVHGRNDHFFDEDQAWALFRAAGEPKRLLLSSRFGHAEDGYDPAFAVRIAGEIRRALSGDAGARGGS